MNIKHACIAYVEVSGKSDLPNCFKREGGTGTAGVWASLGGYLGSRRESKGCARWERRCIGAIRGCFTTTSGARARF